MMIKQVIVVRKDLEIPTGKLAAQVVHAAVSAFRNIESLYYKCRELAIPVSLIEDEGRTVFNEPTLTCIGIGPYFSDEIDNINGNLNLY